MDEVFGGHECGGHVEGGERGERGERGEGSKEEGDLGGRGEFLKSVQAALVYDPKLGWYSTRIGEPSLDLGGGLGPSTSRCWMMWGPRWRLENKSGGRSRTGSRGRLGQSLALACV